MIPGSKLAGIVIELVNKVLKSQLRYGQTRNRNRKLHRSNIGCAVSFLSRLKFVVSLIHSYPIAEISCIAVFGIRLNTVRCLIPG